MAVTPDDIATSIGRPLTPEEVAQAEMWIADTRVIVSHGRDGKSHINLDQMDPPTLDMVVREAVSARILRPDGAKQVSISVDDAQVSRTYDAAAGKLYILDEWWDMLFPAQSPGAFTIITKPDRPRRHAW